MGSNKRPSIKVETHPNPICVTLHFDRAISTSHVQRFYLPLHNETEYLNQVGELGTAIIKNIAEIKGVAEISIQPYELHIERGEVFAWDKIGPQVIRAAKKALHCRKATVTGPDWAEAMSTAIKTPPTTESKPTSEDGN